MIRFIHIKKNGGTSVYKFLRKNNIDFYCGRSTDKFNITNQHLPAQAFKNENSWKFCVVRNPYSRVVSFYNWMKRLSKYKSITFDFFVKTQYDVGRARGVWGLQRDYIVDSNETALIDKIFRFETMAHDISEYFKIPLKFPHLNSGTKDSYVNYYNDTLQEIVYNNLKEDFEYLGYSKCLT